MVSIIVPLYNKAPYVRRALESIFAQSYTDVEVIVVDDGSTDGGPAIVESFGNAARLIVQANAGPGAARNAGIREAHGSLLAFLDADDEWLPGYLERSVALLERDPAAASVTSAWVREPPGTSTVPFWQRRGLKSGPCRVDAQTASGLLVALLAFAGWSCSTVMRAEVVRRYRFYERGSTYGEDQFLTLKILLTEPVILNLEPLAVYHVGASELNSGTVRPRRVEAFLQDPASLYEDCPPELRALLTELLAARALKTACVLTYWGQWREGRALMRRFTAPGAWRLPFFVPAHVAVNPAGTSAAKAWRFLRRVRSRVQGPGRNLPSVSEAGAPISNDIGAAKPPDPPQVRRAVRSSGSD
jgi:GT2 family glycosyltransferase